MLLRAQADLDLDLGSSILVGDKQSDIEAGCSAGVGTQILLSSERILSSKPIKRAPQKTSCYVFPSLDDIRTTFFLSANKSFVDADEAKQQLPNSL
jgi:D-glycero-D-manno-heptose 1,7-bisphosphate phosphatase